MDQQRVTKSHAPRRYPDIVPLAALTIQPLSFTQPACATTSNIQGNRYGGVADGVIAIKNGIVEFARQAVPGLPLEGLLDRR